MDLSCRFYANHYPGVGDVVMVNVTSIGDMGVYVHLLEFNNMNGIIQLSEITRRRIRSIHKLVKVNRNEVAVVLRVDEEKGYVDLSKRQVSPEEVTECEDRFAKAKTVNSILCHVGELLGFTGYKELHELYKRTAWRFDEKYGKPGAAYGAFKQCAKNPEILDECKIDGAVKRVLLDGIECKFSLQAVKIRADVEVVCTTYEGIDAIKRALKEGLKFATENVPVKIMIMYAPLYAITAQTLDLTEGLETLNKVIAAIKRSIEESGGLFNIRSEPSVALAQDHGS